MLKDDGWSGLWGSICVFFITCLPILERHAEWLAFGLSAGAEESGQTELNVFHQLPILSMIMGMASR